MNNHHAWEQEYKKPQFLTMGTEPLADVKEFLRWLKKQARKNAEHFSGQLSDYYVLDLGCGNGKNLKYIIDNYAQSGIGYDISKTAIAEAEKLKDESSLYYEVRSIGETFPLKNKTMDMVLDVTSSNALTESEREIFLQEIIRVTKPGGYVFVRALCLDGDTNAKNLIKQFPGKEKDTYILGDTDIVERVFSKQDFLETYGILGEVCFLEKTSGYQKWGNQSYKRNYWIMYVKMKS